MTKRKSIQLTGAVILSLAVAARAEEKPRETRLTLGGIQRSMRAGLSGAEVLEIAGSPNLVTRTKGGRESWVYDRFTTETSEQGVHFGGGALGSAAGGSAGLLGALGVNAGKKKATTSQRNLLLVVTFGSDGSVESFAYRSSAF